MIMFIQNLVSICQFFLEIFQAKKIRTSIKGRNSVANLQKKMHYNPNIDLVNDDVCTKFGYILSILIPFQAIERKLNCDRVTE